MRYKPLGNTGIKVSVCGFGGYRADYRVREHQQALEQALRGGISLIDTSANYADGGSEQLTGVVLKQLIAEKAIQRSGVTVVTKGGYMQGGNFEKARDREYAHTPFPEVVKCQPGLWHCIHPEFLKDQIDCSLERLGLKKIDVYLLHNPEYFLTYTPGMEPAALREAYYKRIEAAFRYLETECAAGRIGWYGISSNTFGSSPDEEGHTSLERVLAIAGGIGAGCRFGVIQVPMNVYENGPAVNRNQPGSGLTLLELAQREGIGVLLNRPFNAFAGKQLARIADFPVTEAYTKTELRGLVKTLGEKEDSIKRYAETVTEIPASERAGLQECLSLSAVLQQYRNRFSGPNHLVEMKRQFFIPRANYAVQGLSRYRPQDEALRTQLNDYAVTVTIVLDAMQSELARKANAENRVLHQRFDALDGGNGSGAPLTQKALRLYNSFPGVSCTLAGMRRPTYVADVLAACDAEPYPAPLGFWDGF